MCRRAAELGLINQVVANGEALEQACELAARIAANGPLAVAATKQIASGAPYWGWDEGWQQQDELAVPVALSEDAQEGARAFAEKRAPAWKGR
jgi:enoyl-CoA hydratase